MKAEALVDALTDSVEDEEAETLTDTLAGGKDEALVEALGDILIE